MEINEYGVMPYPIPEDTTGITARVTAVHKERYALVCKYGETYGRLKTKEYYGGEALFPTVGDFVVINYLTSGDSQIIATLPRKTFFSRRDPTPGRGEQAVAANFDYVFILQSMNRDFNVKRLERYLTISWQSGATPVVILTKADLATNHEEYVQSARTVAAGVDIHAISAHTGYGMEQLDPYLEPGKTIVFLGSSGVGKSSLVNALAGEEVMAVNGIREEDSKGRHTTTHRQLLRLKNGVLVIDTPGMRQLGMWDVSEGLGEAFADVEQFLGKCRFRDCAHESEPGCAIKAAIESGELSPERWKSYRNLKKEAKHAYAKEEFLRRQRERSRSIKKYEKNRRKETW